MCSERRARMAHESLPPGSQLLITYRRTWSGAASVFVFTPIRVYALQTRSSTCIQDSTDDYAVVALCRQCLSVTLAPFTLFVPTDWHIGMGGGRTSTTWSLELRT